MFLKFQLSKAIHKQFMKVKLIIRANSDSTELDNSRRKTYLILQYLDMALRLCKYILKLYKFETVRSDQLIFMLLLYLVK